jgi:putative ABC transport system ATP-binding protein
MAIKLSDIRYHYAVRPQHTVLNIPSWSLNNGDQVFVHGPSGGGKSTLLGLLSGLLVPNKGQITVLRAALG